MLGISYFRKAGATGHVFFLSGGQPANKGLAYSGIVWPATTVAVVPTTPQIIPFAFNARTADKQDVTVTGDVKVNLSPQVAISKFDFTVNNGGAYLSQWRQELHAIVIAQVLAPVRDKAKELTVETATQSHKDFETALTESMRASGNQLTTKGINVESCSIAKIEASDAEVAQTIGSTERQTMITASDNAIHVRRMNGVTNDRTVKEYEAGTVLELEKKKEALLAEQAKNKKAEAEIDAEATKIRLAPLEDVAAGKLIAAALMKGAETGRFNNVALTSEFLALVGK